MPGRQLVGERAFGRDIFDTHRNNATFALLARTISRSMSSELLAFAENTSTMTFAALIAFPMASAKFSPGPTSRPDI